MPSAVSRLNIPICGNSYFAGLTADCRVLRPGGVSARPLSLGTGAYRHGWCHPPSRQRPVPPQPKLQRQKPAPVKAQFAYTHLCVANTGSRGCRRPIAPSAGTNGPNLAQALRPIKTLPHFVLSEKKSFDGVGTQKARCSAFLLQGFPPKREEDMLSNYL